MTRLLKAQIARRSLPRVDNLSDEGLDAALGSCLDALDTDDGVMPPRDKEFTETYMTRVAWERMTRRMTRAAKLAEAVT
jgi:hypothetical protein